MTTTRPAPAPALRTQRSHKRIVAPRSPDVVVETPGPDVLAQTLQELDGHVLVRCTVGDEVPNTVYTHGLGGAVRDGVFTMYTQDLEGSWSSSLNAGIPMTVRWSAPDYGGVVLCHVERQPVSFIELTVLHENGQPAVGVSAGAASGGGNCGFVNSGVDGTLFCITPSDRAARWEAANLSSAAYFAVPGIPEGQTLQATATMVPTVYPEQTQEELCADARREEREHLANLQPEADELQAEIEAADKLIKIFEQHPHEVNDELLGRLLKEQRTREDPIVRHMREAYVDVLADKVAEHCD